MTTARAIKDWYDDAYSSGGVETMGRPLESFPVFLDLLKVKKGRLLLDVGCGTGLFLLSAVNRGLTTWGIDTSSMAVKIAGDVSPDSFIYTQESEGLRFKDKMFDYVTCIGSLEHFFDMDKSLQEMVRVAKDDARFCIMVPNSDFFYWKISKHNGTKQQEIKEIMLTDRGWRQLFRKNGLDVVEVHQDKWHAKQANIFLKIAWALLPLKWTYCFIYILKKDGAERL